MADQNKFNSKLQGQRVLIIGGSAGKRLEQMSKAFADLMCCRHWLWSRRSIIGEWSLCHYLFFERNQSSGSCLEVAKGISISCQARRGLRSQHG